MPELMGYSHVLSVRDREKSAAFYADVFGFQAFQHIAEEDFDEIVLVQRVGMVLCLQQHRANGGEAADPARMASDHVAFRVGSRAELDAWAAHLARLGVRHSPIAYRDCGAVLCLRDPEEFQLKVFFRERHP